MNRNKQKDEVIFLKKATLYPIGNVVTDQSCYYLNIYKEYRLALKHLNHFSHILIFIENAGNSENPISYEITKVINMNDKKGIIQIDYSQATNHTIIYDIKPYFPCEDRIENCSFDEQVLSKSDWRAEYDSKPLALIGEDAKSKERQGKQNELNFIGQYKRIFGKERIQLPKESFKYLESLKGYSYCRVLWWFDKFDKKAYRKTLLCNPPYENAPKTGVFASRSPVRPNLIASTVVKIVEIDRKNNWLEVLGFDGLEASPVFDLVPYIPQLERVQKFDVPEWLKHWPQWKTFQKEIIIDAEIKLKESDIERVNRLINLHEHGKEEKENLLSNQEINLSPQYQNKENEITIYNAYQNNLKHINTSIPKNKITVITGVSGSGKSSLAFDTIYAQAQSQFMDLLSAEGGLGASLEKPKVDKITGLQPAIAIEQTSLGRNPRSTVGTVTGVGNYVKLLFTTIGTRYCPECHHVVDCMKKEEILEILLKVHPNSKFEIYPYQKQEERKIIEINHHFSDKNKKILLAQYLEDALLSGNGAVNVIIDDYEPFLFQTKQMCFRCNHVLFDLTPSYFNFNNPEYMCPLCKGLGEELKVDESLIVSDPNLSLLDGASKWWGSLRKFMQNMSANWMKGEVIALAREMKVDLELPYKDLPEEFKKQIMYGSNGKKVKLIYENKNGRKGEIERPVEGAYHIITRLFHENTGQTASRLVTEFMTKTVCSKCNGEKLGEEGRLVSIQGMRYPKALQLPLTKLREWILELLITLPKNKKELAKPIIEELDKQLDNLLQVGLSYLTLDRTIPTLSGGEAQRLRLASQFETALTNILYVMDEPTMGLHPKDYQFLIHMIKKLKSSGNTIIMVEHKEDMIVEADKIIDIGPLAGKNGGFITAEGTVSEIMNHNNSITGMYLRNSKRNKRQKLELNKVPQKNSLMIYGARLHNLKNLNVTLPLGAFICVTGVSGSGKSSLITETLYETLIGAINNQKIVPSHFDKIEGAENIKKIINISQQPIGKTPRSNPATYTGVFELIRDFYAKKEVAKQRGYQKEHFSFNSKKGQCKVCNGNGRICTPMHFMPDIWTTCSHCKGKRYQSEILEVTHHGNSIADVLDMDIDEALEFFKEERKIYNIIKMISDVGLGYMKLGQSALTLSGGEAQRIKLAKELSQETSNDVLYILDEPTTGLHFEDINKLLEIIVKLVSKGNTIIAIEHNLDFIISADYVIDMGPEGGNNGGYIIAEGTIDQIIENSASVTGQFIKSKRKTQQQ